MYVNVLNNTRGKFYFVIQKKTENICRMMPEVRDLKKKMTERAARGHYFYKAEERHHSFVLEPEGHYCGHWNATVGYNS